MRIFTEQQLAALRESVPTESLKRNQEGFLYIDTHYVISKLNELFGPDGWTSKVTFVDVKDTGDYVVTTVAVQLGIETENGSVFKSDVGTDVGKCDNFRMLKKSAATAYAQALKRAASSLGSVFGLDLKDKDFNGASSDEEIDEGEEEAPVTRKVVKAAKTAAKANNAAPKCADCGNSIEGFKGSNGTYYKAEALAKSRARKYGRPLCSECVKEATPLEG